MSQDANLIKDSIDLQQTRQKGSWDKDNYPKFIHYLKSKYTGSALSIVKKYIQFLDIIENDPSFFRLITQEKLELLPQMLPYFSLIKNKSSKEQIIFIEGLINGEYNLIPSERNKLIKALKNGGDRTEAQFLRKMDKILAEIIDIKQKVGRAQFKRFIWTIKDILHEE